MKSIVMLACVIICILMGLGENSKLLRSSDDMPDNLEIKKAKVEEPEAESFTERDVPSAIDRLASTDLDNLENLLAEGWESSEVDGKTWGYQAGFKCSPVMRVATSSATVTPAWKTIVDKITSSRDLKYTRLAACLLTPGLLPPPESPASMELLAPKIEELARRAIPKIKQVTKDMDFFNDLHAEMIRGISPWIPIVSTMSRLLLDCEDSTEQLEVLKDFETAWSLKEIFLHPQWILLFPDPMGTLELLKHLDYGLATSKNFLLKLLLQAICLDDVGMVDYLHQNGHMKDISSYDTFNSLLRSSLAMIQHLDELGYLLPYQSSTSSIEIDRVDILSYVLDKKYISIDYVRSHLETAYLRNSSKVLDYLATTYQVHFVPDASTLENVILNCDLEKFKLILESKIVPLPKSPKKYESLSATRKPQCLQIMQLAFQHLMEATDGHTAKFDMELISCDFWALTSGNIPVLNWIKETLEAHNLSFPPPTQNHVHHAVACHAFEGLRWYKEAFSSPIPHLDSVAEHYRRHTGGMTGAQGFFFKEQGLEITMDDLSNALSWRDLDAFKFVHQYFNQYLPRILDDQVLCKSIDLRQHDFFQWATTVYPQRFRRLVCHIDMPCLSLPDLSFLKIVHERIGWLPPGKWFDEKLGRSSSNVLEKYDMMRWGLEVLAPTWKFSRDVVRNFIASKNTLALRLLATIDPEGYIVANAYMMATLANKEWGMHVLEWFPFLRDALFATLLNMRRSDFLNMSDEDKTRVRDAVISGTSANGNTPVSLLTDALLSKCTKEVALWLLS